MTQETLPGWVKPTLEMGPVLGFFAAYLWLKDRAFTFGGVEYEGFVVVTAGFIPVFLLSMGILWWLTGHLSKMQVMTAVLIVVFGGLSVWFNDPKFFKMKPTIIYLLFGSALGLGLLRGKSYLQSLMGGVMPLTEQGWMILTRRMALFFFVLAILNEIIWRNMSEETWVYFKTFGVMAATVLFFMAQGRVFREHGTADETTE